MPAAAVIPAPIAYIKVAAVKKLVVGFLVRCPWVAAFYPLLGEEVVCFEVREDCSYLLLSSFFFFS